MEKEKKRSMENEKSPPRTTGQEDKEIEDDVSNIKGP